MSQTKMCLFGFDRFVLKRQISPEKDSRDEEPTHAQQTGGNGVVKIVCKHWHIETTNSSLLDDL